jgi:hypothetical protein
MPDDIPGGRVSEFFGLTPDAEGFVHIPAERHPVRVVAKGRDDNLDEFIIVTRGGPEEPPSYLALSLDDATPRQGPSSHPA